MFDKIKAKAEDLTEGHPDQAEKVSDKGIEGAGHLVDEKTGNKFDSQIEKGETFVDGKIGNDGHQA
jgi:MT0933-like antitoxin protein